MLGKIISKSGFQRNFEPAFYHCLIKQIKPIQIFGYTTDAVLFVVLVYIIADVAL